VGGFRFQPLKKSGVIIITFLWLKVKEYFKQAPKSSLVIEGSLEVKLPTIWTDEKQSRAEAERRGRLVERRSEEKE